jgi:DNA-binding LacI/PurR family transcriptional regulator
VSPKTRDVVKAVLDACKYKPNADAIRLRRLRTRYILSEELSGISVFCKDKSSDIHIYSGYARGRRAGHKK